MDSKCRETEDGWVVYGFGYIVEVRFQQTDLVSWSVNARDAGNGMFECFAVFEGEAIQVHRETF